jgi:hypothetical protein
MNAERNQIMALFVALGEFYRVDVKRHQAEMYAKAVEDIPMDDIARAMEAVQRTSKFFPMPVEIRELALGSAKDEALEAANRIVEAMHRFGWTNPDRAKTFIGALGWRVVEREGGWTALCQRVDSDDLPILKAQWRELAAATLRRGASGLHDSAPALGITKQKQERLVSLAAMLPIISKGGTAK